MPSVDGATEDCLPSPAVSDVRPKLAQLRWQNVAPAVTGERTPQAAMDNLAEQMDRIFARLERAGMKNCAPKLNPKKEASAWLSTRGAPWSRLANEILALARPLV